MRTVHILGFGNPLHGDDGLGPALIERLLVEGLPPGVRAFDVGTRGLDALPLLTGCDAALLVDAAAPAGAPGALASHSAAEVMAMPLADGHQAGVVHLLRCAAALGPLPTLRVLTVQAMRVAAFRPGLSEPVAAAMDTLVERVHQWLGADPARAIAD